MDEPFSSLRHQACLPRSAPFRSRQYGSTTIDDDPFIVAYEQRSDMNGVLLPTEINGCGPSRPRSKSPTCKTQSWGGQSARPGPPYELLAYLQEDVPTELLEVEKGQVFEANIIPAGWCASRFVYPIITYGYAVQGYNKSQGRADSSRHWLLFSPIICSWENEIRLVGFWAVQISLIKDHTTAGILHASETQVGLPDL